MNEFVLINKYLKKLTKNNTGALKLNDDVFFDNFFKYLLNITNSFIISSNFF